MRLDFIPKGRFVLILYEYRYNSESICEQANVGAASLRASLVASRIVVTLFPNSLYPSFLEGDKNQFVLNGCHERNKSRGKLKPKVFFLEGRLPFLPKAY